MRATLLGSWPGVNVQEAARIHWGELASLEGGTVRGIPLIPELPARGVGADMIGRTAALLVDLPVETDPSGWRFTQRPGRDISRAQSLLRQDLDVLAEHADGYVGPLKVQVSGPWTLAASILKPRLERAVSDAGLCRDITASLIEGLREHVARVQRLVPGAELIVQIDEPALAAVAEGTLPTASGFSRIPAVEPPLIPAALKDLREALHAMGTQMALHSCAPRVAPILAAAQPDAISLDVGLLTAEHWDSVAEAVESGTQLWVGSLPSHPNEIQRLRTTVKGSSAHLALHIDALTMAWQRVGLELIRLQQVTLTPACGLSGASPDAARWMLERLRHLVKAFDDALAQG